MKIFFVNTLTKIYIYKSGILQKIYLYCFFIWLCGIIIEYQYKGEKQLAEILTIQRMPRLLMTE